MCWDGCRLKHYQEDEIHEVPNHIAINWVDAGIAEIPIIAPPENKMSGVPEVKETPIEDEPTEAQPTEDKPKKKGK